MCAPILQQCFECVSLPSKTGEWQQDDTNTQRGWHQAAQMMMHSQEQMAVLPGDPSNTGAAHLCLNVCHLGVWWACLCPNVDNIACIPAMYATTCRPPPATIWGPMISCTCVGKVLSCILPSPSWPLVPAPQHHMLLAELLCNYTRIK